MDSAATSAISALAGGRGAALRRWSLRLGIVAAAVIGFVLIRAVPALLGDGLEYAAVLYAWINHASPDVRAEDVVSLPHLFESHGHAGLHPNTVVTGVDGRTYGVHFWLYSLVCAPAALVIRAAGYNPLTGFPVTNTILFAAFIAAGCWWRRLTRRDRILIALAAVSPVIRSLHIAHPEAFTWACVLASLIGINHARYGVAAVCAAMGAMQNPPVATLALYAVLIAAYEHGWRRALLPAAGAALALVPSLFSWLAVGHFNPVHHRGYLDFSWGMADRAWGFFIDLDQGLLAYVPGLLVLAAIAVVRARSVRTLGMLIVLGLFLAGAATNIGATNPFRGLMRYAIWMLPVLAWLATETMRSTPRPRLLLLTLLLHAALVAPRPPAPEENGHVAAYVLGHWPAWYRPAPANFATRVANLDIAEPHHRFPPIGFVRDDGVVTKLLVDAAGWRQLDGLFAVEPTYLRTVAAEALGRSGRFYLNPPVGAVRSRCAVGNMSVDQLRAISVRVVDAPVTSAARPIVIWVEVTNHGDQPFCNAGGGGRITFSLSFRIRQDGRLISDGAHTRGPQILLPGVTERRPLHVGLPRTSGRYDVEILPVLGIATPGLVGDTLIVDVRAEGPSYHALISKDSFRSP